MKPSRFGKRAVRYMLRPVLCSVLTWRNRQYLICDVLLLSLTPAWALMLRVESSHEFRILAPAVGLYTLVAVALRVVGFYLFGLYDRYWRYAAVDDLARIIRAGLTTTAVLV